MRRLEEAITAGKRVAYDTGTKWEPVAVSLPLDEKPQTPHSKAWYFNIELLSSHPSRRGYPRLRHYGKPTGHPASQLKALGGGCARCQTIAILDIISRAVRKLGGAMADVVRTRVIIRKEEDCEQISLAHGWVFRCEGVRPSNTLSYGWAGRR